MIDVKIAADKALEYLNSFYPDVQHVQLEEVELTDDKQYWNITLSYQQGPNSSSPIMALGFSTKYKIFKIEAESGEVLSMKIRTLK